MSRAQEVAEGMGITLSGITTQPSQVGSVPTAPPRGSSMVKDPEMDVTTPKVLDLRGRRRQEKALDNIKRKFESRYGTLHEELSPEQKRIINKMKYDEIEKFKRERISRLTPYDTPIGPSPETSLERERRIHREQEDDRIAARQRGYVFSQTIRDPEDITADRGRGIFGLGKQKEADIIGRALMSNTLFKLVKIKPYGSGVRVEIEATSHDGGEVSVYLQKMFKVLLFNKVVAGSNRQEIQKVISTIISNLPSDWKIAADPRMVQKVVANINRKDPKSRGQVHGAHTLRKMLSNVNPNRIADRSIFLKVKRDEVSKSEPTQDGSEYSGPDRRDPERGRVGKEFRGTTLITPELFAQLGPEAQAAYIKAMAQKRAREEQQAQHDQAAAFGGSSFYDIMGTAHTTASRGDIGDLENIDPYTNPTSGGFGNDVSFDIMGNPIHNYPSFSGSDMSTLRGKENTPIRRTEIRSRNRVVKEQPEFSGEPVILGSASRPEPEEEITDYRHRRGIKDFGTSPFYSESPGELGQQPRRGRGFTEPAPQGAYDTANAGFDDLLQQARTYKGQMNINAPIVQYVAEKMKRVGLGQPTIREGDKRGIIIETPILHAVVRRKGNKDKLRTVILEFPWIDLNNAIKVFDSIPRISWPPKASHSLSGFKLNHRVDISSLVNFIDKNKPSLLPDMLDILSPWIERMGQQGITKGTIRGKAKRERQRQQTRPQRESVASVILQALSPIEEQLWYKEIVPLAKEIQGWILRHLGGYEVTGTQIHDRFDDEHTPETVDKAIEILRANSAIYPMSNDVYMINMSRLSSALL